MSGRRRGGLGRGLGALIGPPDSGLEQEPGPQWNGHGPADIPVVSSASTTGASGRYVRQGADPAAPLVDVPGVRFADLPVRAIRANPKQPRSVFDEGSLDELAHSVREFGVLQPIVVREVGDGGYELVMGERRLRACIMAGLDTIPAIVRDTGDDALLRDALLENIHRVQLNPLEEAAAYQQLLQEFGVTHDELAGRLGRSRSHVSNTIRLLGLSVPVQRRVAAGVLSAGHARALLSMPVADDQDELAARIVAEGLSVRATEEIVAIAAARGGLDRPGARRPPTPRFTAPAVADLIERLSDAFDTRVRVDIGKRKGRIIVEFATLADLERIVGVMAPDLQPVALTEASASAQRAQGTEGINSTAGTQVTEGSVGGGGTHDDYFVRPESAPAQSAWAARAG